MNTLRSFHLLAFLRIIVTFVSNVQCLNLVKVASSIPSSKSSRSSQGKQSEQGGFQSFLSSPKSDILVSFVESHEPFLQSFSQRSFNTRSEKNAALTHALMTMSTESQAPVIQTLKSFHANSESYWISNQVFVKDASQPLVQSLASMPMVKSVAEDMKIPLPPVFNVSVGKEPNGPEWNIRKIGAHKVWNDTTGENVIVGGIDTGVRGTHTSLKNNYVGRDNYGWHDPFLGVPDPEDNHGHG